ncbi:4-hydroxyphenylpyruvate dioxygenase-like protein isoform X2 [Physella acuta]|uniref:4-hydroxyphenylpyruvate dioxygenase-like protein isoform X2 n=1 Tax=Physella acuta TaxID=109671 RepID=UPI0027DC381E|nr:4-hydroxyphenylpyruvate dioxygenase-like protein isoform X2 [Physella acuta]
MACFPCVHHIEVGVTDGPGAIEVLKLQYGFKVKAVRHSQVADQWLMVRSDTRFLITSLKSQDQSLIQNDNYAINWASRPAEPSPLPEKPSVFNIAFQVKNIDVCIQRLQAQNVAFPKTPRTVTDTSGSVNTCVIKSCVGDVYHTLLDKSSYTGSFLPEFIPVGKDDVSQESGVSGECADSLTQSFDHVALAVEMNKSMSVIEWYEKCFGMKRFLINRQEIPDEGLVLSTDNVGLRLRAMEYWKCAEVGLTTPRDDGVLGRLSLVVAEGLPPVPGSSEENQIESWMKQHGGAGIQHVAVLCTDIKSTVSDLRRCGAAFAKPPPDTYYTEIGRLYDIQEAGEELSVLKENGILIDTEADGIHAVTHTSGEARRDGYLLQIFTQPLLKKDPFFLEFIQREGATGFGSGNVAALYRSVQAYIVGQQN